MSENKLNGFMDTSLLHIKDMVDVNTIVGDPVTAPGGVTIIPISKVTFGFASGGSDFTQKQSQTPMFGGGSGAGVTITPIAFLVVSGNDVKLLPINSGDTPTDAILNSVPGFIDKMVNVVDKYVSKKDAKKDIPGTAEEAAEIVENS